MKKIVPFKKEISFKTNLKEITSISLEHNLNINDHLINGSFNISGEYKMLETSVNEEEFNYEIPFTVQVDDKYIMDNAIIDIDDFYYEVKENNILEINIDVLIDNLEEKILENSRCIEEEKEEKKDIMEVLTSTEEEKYKSYTVYIVRENDTLETIMNKYNITKEKLAEYNDLSELKIGDKIIIS